MRVVFATLTVFLLYLVFAGTVSRSETITGAVLSGLGAGGVLIYARISARRFAFSLAHLRPWGRAMGRVPGATARTGRALFVGAAKALPGSAADVPFRHGAVDDPGERARRATAVLAASLAPSSFVVRIEPGHDTALMHGIEPRLPPTDPEWLA